MEEQREEPGGKKKEAGLKKTTMGLMIAVAIFFDLLQIVLDFFFMGWLVTIFGGMTFFLWFKIHGYSFLKPKRVAGSMATLITDAVPILGWFSWTIAITIFTLKNKLQETVPGGGLAMAVVDHKNQKGIQAKNNAAVNNMQRLDLRDKKAAEKPKPQRGPSKMVEDHRSIEWKEKMRQHEEFLQQHRKRIEDYGGYEKWDRDLAEARFRADEFGRKSDRMRKEGREELDKLFKK